MIASEAIIDGQQFIYVIGMLCSMLVIGWFILFFTVNKSKEKVQDLLTGNSFLQNLKVIGIVITTGFLAITGILKGELTDTLLSGVVGYVLGSTRKGPRKNSSQEE